MPENASAFQYSRSRQPYHCKPGDDAEPSLMACAGSRAQRRKMLEKNKQPDVVQSNPLILDYLARCNTRNAIGSKNTAKPLKREPPMVPAGFSLDQLHTVVKTSRPDDKKRNYESNTLTKAHETNISNTLNYIHRSPKQFERHANRSREPPALNTSTSIDNFEVNWNQPRTGPSRGRGRNSLQSRIS